MKCDPSRIGDGSRALRNWNQAMTEGGLRPWAAISSRFP